MKSVLLSYNFTKIKRHEFFTNYYRNHALGNLGRPTFRKRGTEIN